MLESLFMVLIALALFGLSVLMLLGEMYEEWIAGTEDWYAAHMFRYVVIFGAILALTLAH